METPEEELARLRSRVEGLAVELETSRNETAPSRQETAAAVAAAASHQE